MSQTFKIRIAILGDNQPSFRKPLALSISRMLTAIGTDNVVFYNGLDILRNPTVIEVIVSALVQIVRGPIEKLLNAISRNRQLFGSLRARGRKSSSDPPRRQQPIVSRFSTFAFRSGRRLESIIATASSVIKPRPALAKLSKELGSFDAVIICVNLPDSLAKRRYRGIEILRRKLSIPIIDYDLHFWATLGGMWCQRLISEPDYGGFAGFDRFDYYIAVSNISEFPMQKNIDWPLAVVGGDFRSPELYPEQTEFRALVDFQRNHFLVERDIQIQALEKLNIPYTILSGTYSHSELYAIFRKHSVYFLAHRESFGLPIVELQHCGCYIFTPYRTWAPSHYIGKSSYERGEGALSRNFIVYDNDPNILEQQLLRIRNSYNPNDVISEFSARHPAFVDGDLAALQSIVTRIMSRKIYRGLGKSYIGLEQYCGDINM